MWNFLLQSLSTARCVKNSLRLKFFAIAQRLRRAIFFPNFSLLTQPRDEWHWKLIEKHFRNPSIFLYGVSRCMQKENKLTDKESLLNWIFCFFLIPRRSFVVFHLGGKAVYHLNSHIRRGSSRLREREFSSFFIPNKKTCVAGDESKCESCLLCIYLKHLPSFRGEFSIKTNHFFADTSGEVKTEVNRSSKM